MVAICLYCDTMKTQAKAKNNVYNEKSRKTQYYHMLSNWVISIQFVRLKENIADPLTKVLPREKN